MGNTVSTSLIAGIILIALGLALILCKKKAALPVSQTVQAAKVEEPKTEKPKKEVIRSVPLEELKVPQSFPQEIVFYFGTQTGTAEKFCTTLEHEIVEIFNRQPCNTRQARVIDFEEFTPESFNKHQLVVVCASTHYEGDPTDNMKKYFRWLRDTRKDKSQHGILLKGQSFIVFGLGDTSYEQYNYIGKFVNEGLEELGAERVYRYGEGNAEGNKTEDDFNEWKADLWQQLFEHYATKVPVSQLSEEVKPIVEQAPAQLHVVTGKQYPLAIEMVPAGTELQINIDVPLELVTKQYLSGKDVKIKQIRELRQKYSTTFDDGSHIDETEGGSTLEITYDLEGTGLSYKSATNLALFPENPIDDVKLCAEILGFDINSIFAFKPNPNAQSKRSTTAKHPFPTPVSVGEALRKYVDLRGTMRKKLLTDLISHAKNDSVKQRLTELSSKEKFAEEIEKPMMGLLDVLQWFPRDSWDLPIDAFFQITDRLMPRYYTIASSNLMYPTEVKIAISLTVDMPRHGQKRLGQASKFVHDKTLQKMPIIKKNDIIPHHSVTTRIFIKDSSFTLPPDPSISPIIMVGPGTGVVPFIAFLQERHIEITQKGEQRAHAHLFFGCRKSDSDYIYKEEIEEYHKSGVLTKAHLAFSREQGGQKVYVQDLLRKESQLVIEALTEKKGCLYMCGSTRMGQDVQALLKELLGEEGFRTLEKEKRLIKELWG